MQEGNTLVFIHDQQADDVPVDEGNLRQIENDGWRRFSHLGRDEVYVPLQGVADEPYNRPATIDVFIHPEHVSMLPTALIARW